MPRVQLFTDVGFCIR